MADSPGFTILIIKLKGVKSDFSKCTFFAQFFLVILKLRKLLVKLYFTRNIQKITDGLGDRLICLIRQNY